MWICPECRYLYRTKEKTCQRDGFKLVPVQASQAKAKYPLLEKIVDGRYRLIAGLGQGGLGTVYLALHERLEQLFAIKFLDLETVGIQADAEQSEEYRSDFMAEARVASKIHHDSVVRVTDFGEFENLPYLVMDYVAGTSLLGMLGHRGRFSVSEAINIAWSIAEALSSFHERKLIHRDLKPANVILDPRGGHLTLVDLGLVKDISGYGGKASTHPMALRGTPGYLAPEQVPSWVLSGISTSQSQTKKLVDARVDMYALGVMLYEMVAGVSPYPDGSNTQIIIYACTKDPLSLRGVEPPIDLPEALEQLIYDTMARDPDRRPATAADFIERLKGLTGGRRPRDWPEVIMLTQRSTLQGVLPPKSEANVPNQEPSVLSVFGDDSELSPPHLLTLDSDKTIEADTGSFNDVSFVSVDTRTSVGGLDSRSRYHTAELTRTVSEISSSEQSIPTSAHRPMQPTPSHREMHADVRRVSSETVGAFERPPAEKSALRYGFYMMLLGLIGVLAFLVFQSTQSGKKQGVADPSSTQAEQPQPAPGPKTKPEDDGANLVNKKAVNPNAKPLDAGIDEMPKSDEMPIPNIKPTEKVVDVKKAKPIAPPRVQPKARQKKPITSQIKDGMRKREPRQTIRPQKTAKVRKAGRPRTQMALDALKRRGDAALRLQDCSGALAYYRKFLERAPTSHRYREDVLTRVYHCRSKK